MTEKPRNLVVVLGDQLNRDASAFDGFDRSCDTVWMAEAAGESRYAWSSRQRTALFLSAMRHFAASLRAEGIALHYLSLDATDNRDSLASALAGSLARLRPAALLATQPGEWRLQEMLREVAAVAGVPLDLREDRHFLCSPAQFAGHARSRSALRMEYFYREQRVRLGILMDGGQPCGGAWNFDASNRQSFGSDGPGFLPAPPAFAPDALTRQVLALVEQRFADHPGTLERFDWPVTRAQALEALEDFIASRLPLFGHWQDAMWTGEPLLYHARISAALNLKLLDPREVIAAAQLAWREGRAPLPATEGFIRQILGWREYVRGIYWSGMPGYLEHNALDARLPLPAWYWSGDTPMQCLREVISQTLRTGYAHHIQRLMVTGLYALLLGVDPHLVHLWYLAVYVDAVEWVEAPNTIGMSQYADGGLMASKPYIASGRYIDGMSDYCRGCRFKPEQRTGADACPFTTLYWDFLDRHAGMLLANPRMAPQVRNLQRLPPAERAAITAQAAELKAAAFSSPGWS
ncbi:MAG: cryptochrome/photolyase family protein [Comamonadaceae bacterium]|nr:MAG: cryptochrome/photolyase family protein [Comamonadaceae bacterium]